MTGEPPVLRLARDLTVHFAHLPAEQAARAVAEHIRLFWEPRMRSALHEAVSSRPADLDERVRLAASLLEDAGGPRAMR